MRAREIAARIIERALGRRNLVRLSRFLLDSARLDLPNRVDVNGERLVQRAVLRGVSQPLVIFDVGANVGQWTRQLAAEATNLGVAQHVTVHAFEPSSFTFDQLVANVRDTGLTVVPVRLAASASTGRATLYKVVEGAGSNSLLESASAFTETVGTTTLDSYCETAGIETITLLKSDAEGHDMQVLCGAASLLRRQAIEVVQFEYNHRWIGGRAFLRDAFDLLGKNGYQLGKVTRRGIEWYPGWDWELETYREGNYIGALEPSRLGIPSVSWWKQRPNLLATP